MWDHIGYDQQHMASAFNRYWRGHLRGALAHWRDWQEADLQKRNRLAAFGWTKDTKGPVVKNTTGAELNPKNPTAGWILSNMDDEPPNLDFLTHRQRAIIESRDDLYEFVRIKEETKAQVTAHAADANITLTPERISAIVEALLNGNARYNWLKESLWQ